MIASGCAAATSTPRPSPTPTLPPTSTATISPSPSLTPSATGTSTFTPTPVPQVCSPLAGIGLDELPSLMTGDKFNPPAPGQDSGHHGVDFAFYRHGSLTTMLGLPVQSILPGRVAAVIDNRKPYGNAIIIETPLEDLPFQSSSTIKEMPAAPTVQSDPRLTCPKPQEEPWLNSQKRSLYTLYAHFNKPPPVKAGETVSCGQTIGEVGTTGNSVNPHVHLETRLGPSGASFSSLGHYDTRLSDEERSNYCTWRVSGWFQMFDPIKLLLPTAP